MPPLLQRLSELDAQRLDWIGVSYGLTQQLFKFWKRAGYVPMYVRQTTNDLTGEHTCVMIRGVHADDGQNSAWISDFAKGEQLVPAKSQWLMLAIDFRKRFISLLSYKFREFPSVMSLSLLEAANAGIKDNSDGAAQASTSTLGDVFSPHDMKRLVSYGNNMLDYHVILDLLPGLAGLYFENRFDTQALRLSGLQSAILLALGLQRKSIEDIEKELKLPVSQGLAMFVKTIRKFTTAMDAARKQEIDSTIEVDEDAIPGMKGQSNAVHSVAKDVEAELQEEGDEVTRQMRAEQRDVIDSLNLQDYRIGVPDKAFAGAKPGKVHSVQNPESTKRKSKDVEVTQGKKQKKQK